MTIREEIVQLAKDNLADIVGFAPAARFSQDSEIFKIYPEVKTVVGLAFRVLRGIYRGIEEGSTYYQYTTMAVENMEETIMPMAQIKVANLLEQYGFLAFPQRRHQQVMPGEGGTNPEVAWDMIYHNCDAEHQMDFAEAGVLCGLGERGLSGALLTEEFGPMVRYCFILTNAILEETPIKDGKLCDGCKACIGACPGHAISEDGQMDSWQCAVYYNGACGEKNPFMPPDAYQSFDNRLEIIAGEAQVIPEFAKEILKQTFFYPPAQHAYPCSICGRACDMACYAHLEEKGVLSKKFRTPFRRRKPWKFSMWDFRATEMKE